MKKRLLVLTQVIDRQNSALGFFHRWVVEFAKHVDTLTVICLWRGDYELPNVKVLSLGKENKPSRVRYIFLFFKYIWQERKNYDAVFVHMNEEFILLGSLFWKLWGKKIAMWRNHAQGTLFTKFAVAFSDVAFCTSPKSYTARFKKTKVVPAGIDTSQYDGKPYPAKNSILFFGRLSPVKNVHVFIESLHALHEKGIDFKADIIGSPLNPEDFEYKDTLNRLGESLVSIGKLTFKDGISHEETSSLYRKYSLYVNLTPDGSLDKTMLEAMASRTPVLLSNSAFRGYLPGECQLTSLEAGSVSEKIKNLLALSDAQSIDLGEKLRKYVDYEHGLVDLIKLLVKEISS